MSERVHGVCRVYRVESSELKETEIGLIPKDWEVVKFEENIIKKQINVGKLKQQEYKKFGKFPVINQGQKFIEGYCDKEDLVYKGIYQLLYLATILGFLNI